LLAVFGEVFEERDRYEGHQPSDAYLGELLGSNTFMALDANSGGRVIAALTACMYRRNRNNP
jgi:hypothetical protein